MRRTVRTRRSATPAQMEPVRAPALRDALRDAEIHPITPDPLGARVVAVLGPPSSQWAPRGVSSSGHALAIDPMCAPRRLEVLYVLLRPTQSRPARSARTWWPVLGPLVSRWPPRGVTSSGLCSLNRSLCALRPSGVLGWLS